MSANTQIVGLLLATLAITGCIDDAQTCDDSCDAADEIPADASVVVRVTDSDGQPIRAGSVTYSVYTEDGGEPVADMTDLAAECFNEQCTTWIAGRDVAGHFFVSAAYENPDRGCTVSIDDEVTVDLAQDGHPVTREVTLPVTEGSCQEQPQ